MLNITKVDNFPELTRSGRVSGELQGIIDALLDSANLGDRFALSGIEPGKAYNSMQQRIRSQAKKLNLKIVIRYDADDLKLYFRASHMVAPAVLVDVIPMVAVNDNPVDQDDFYDEGVKATEIKASDVKAIRTGKASVK